jgi:hypothetical protein
MGLTIASPLNVLGNSAEPSDEVADSHIVERDRTHLTEQEQALLKELLRPGVSIDSVIPPEASAENLWKTLDACIRGMGILETRMLRLRPVIGKLLVIFENKPSLYKELGYETWSEFMKNGVNGILGLHRTAAYQSLYVAREWKQIDPDRYAKLGPKRMEILKQVTTGSSPNAETWLKTAESMKVGQLQAYVEQRGFTTPGETAGATITIPTNQAVYSQWRGLIGDGRIQSWVGSKEPGKILEAMIQETYNEWVTKYEESRKAKK